MERVTSAEARRLRPLSVRRLAEAAGVAPTTVYHIEHGRTAPSFRVIRDMHRPLSVTCAEPSILTQVQRFLRHLYRYAKWRR